MFEKLLLLFCFKGPSEVADHTSSSDEKSLVLLESEFEDFRSHLKGKSVCDFGCGVGLQAKKLSTMAYKVVGVENYKENLLKAKQYCGEAVELVTNLKESSISEFDIILSKNSFEHFDHPLEILLEWKKFLKKEGSIFLTFGPPWYAPYGAHFRFFCWLPWVQIFFSEKTILRVRQNFRDDQARTYDEIPGGLNQMTLRKLEGIISESGLEIKYVKYTGVKGLNLFCKVPILRELFTNHISLILQASK